MKRVLIIIAAIFLFGIIFSSCKSHKPCPAYGHVETETEVNA